MKIMIVAEGSEENLDLLLEIARKFDIKISKPTDSAKSSYMENQKNIYENTYQPWTEDDDEKLEMLYYIGKKVKEISEIFGRNEGAISSRIKKLELFEKYGKR